MHYHPGYDARAILEQHRSWARQFADPLAAAVRAHDNDRSPGRRLKVGFVSASFCDCAQGQLIQPLFREHDRNEYEFIAYSDSRKADGVTASIRATLDGWRDTARLADAELAELIRADRIDILVDLTLHTANSRLLVFARKPAPVQVTMLEMITTTGLDAMDYRLTDPYLDPPGQTDGDYTERSVRLPDCAWCYQPPPEAPAVNDLPARRNGFVTFGCQNHFVKLSRPAVELWARVLQVVPGAGMLMYSPARVQREAVLRVFDQAGVHQDRVGFLSRVSPAEYIGRFRDFDIGLDTQPYAGGTTTQDSLWMGVPVVTLRGRTAVGRGGVSILSNAGLRDLIAQTEDDYVTIAAALASNLERLAELRAALRPQMERSPLMDARRYAASVEAAFRAMWQSWCGTG
jgi:predicted O-linked N-acetylglucosamine transferase (SPINDLY family)